MELVNSMHEAARTGQIEELSKILSQGIDADIMDDDGYTLLHLACQEGYEEVAKLLVENGANVEAVTNDGFFPRTVNSA